MLKIKQFILKTFFASIFATLIFGYCSQTLNADKLFLNDGREYSGRLLNITGGEMTFIMADSPDSASFKLSEINSINLQKLRKYHNISRVDELKNSDSVIKKYFDVEISADSFPDAGSATLYSKTEYIHLNGDSYKIKSVILKKILRKRAESEGTNSYYYYSSYDSPSIEFALSVNEYGIVKHLDDNALKDEALYSGQLYNNLKRLRFSLPETKEGSYIYYSTETIRKYDESAFPFYISQIFKEKEPIIYKCVSINIPADKEIEYFVNDSGQIKISKSIAGARKILEFSVENSDAFSEEEYMPPLIEIFPSLIVSEKNQWKNIAGNFLNEYQKKINNNKALDFILENLKINNLSNEKKMSAIYDFTVKNFETEGIPPQYWKYGFYDLDILVRYMSGNYFDKILFLSALLKKSGLNPSFVLCKSGESGKLSGAVNLREFNFALCKIRINDKIYFLAPFDKTAPLGTFPSELHNTEALEISPDGNFAFFKLPSDNKLESNGIHKNIVMKLNENNSAVCEETVKFYGNASINMRTIVFLNQSEINKMFEKTVAAIHNNAELIDYSVSEHSSDSNEFIIKYKYSIKNYAITAGDKIKCFRIPGAVQSGFEFNNTERTFDIKWFGNEFNKTTCSVSIPEKFKIYYLPEKFSSTFSDIEINSEYSFRNNEISFISEFSRKTGFIKKSDYDGLRSIYLNSAIYSQEWIVLSQKSQ
ncbi:MAG TPA: DUF3857 domain-containing protein [bacterium]|nr:DUF3857 domain-containing protein [bacterium]